MRVHSGGVQHLTPQALILQELRRLEGHRPGVPAAEVHAEPAFGAAALSNAVAKQIQYEAG